MKVLRLKNHLLFNPWRVTSSRLLRTALILSLYILFFTALDWQTSGFQMFPNVVAWYPPHGMSFALVLALGWQVSPVLIVTSLISNLFIYQVPVPVELLFGWALIVASMYGGVAWVLRGRLRLDLQLKSIRDVIKLVVTSAVLAAVLAVIAIYGDTSSEAIAFTDRFVAAFTWWIGETVGLLVTTPFLLLYVMPSVKAFIAGTAVARPADRELRPRIAVGAAVSVLVILFLVFGAPTLAPFQPIYLIAIPLLWVSLEYGIKGASAGIFYINFATTYAIWFSHSDLTQLSAVQLFMLVLAAASLIMGAVRTEQIEAAKETSKSEKYFRALVENSLEEVSLIAPDGTLIYESPKASRPLGYTYGSWIGRSLFDLIHPDDQPQARQLLGQVIREPGVHQTASFRLQHSNGDWRWMEGVLTNLLEEPAVQAIVINYRDVTERRQAEEEIRLRTDELMALYGLSRSLAETDSLEKIFDLVNCHVVEQTHVTFAGIALLEDDNLRMKAVYSLRAVRENDWVDMRVPAAAIPFCQRLLQDGEPVLLQAGDPRLNPQEQQLLLLDVAQTACLIPLRSSEQDSASKQALGLLLLGERRGEGSEPFTAAKMRLAQSIGDQAAVAIHRMLLQKETERRLQQLMALREIDQAITSSFGWHLSLHTLLTQVIHQLHVDAAVVWIYDPRANVLRHSAGQGFIAHHFQQEKPASLAEGPTGRVVLERRTVQITNLMSDEAAPYVRRRLGSEAFVSYYGVPLIARGDIKGVLEIFHRSPIAANKEWSDFLQTLAGQAAIAIDNGALFDDLQRSHQELSLAYDETIAGWSRALDLRDKETEGHTQRVTTLTVLLARGFGFSEEEVANIRRGALLHDIGKMGIPDSILLKEGSLTDEEWAIMRQHPVFAYEMLAPIEYLRAAIDIPYCHHEKWDGTGYPRGLKAEEIPLAARIFAIVDVWDALRSDRPYRKAWSRERVFAHLQSLSGTHFDPHVLKVVLESGILGETEFEAPIVVSDGASSK